MERPDDFGLLRNVFPHTFPQSPPKLEDIIEIKSLGEGKGHIIEFKGDVILNASGNMIIMSEKKLGLIGEEIHLNPPIGVRLGISMLQEFEAYIPHDKVTHICSGGCSSCQQ